MSKPPYSVFGVIFTPFFFWRSDKPTSFVIMKVIQGLCLLLLVAAPLACEEGPVAIDDPAEKYDPAVEVTHDVDILYSDSARVRVRIQGPRMLNYNDRRDPRQEFPDGVQVDFFGPEQEISSTLTAKYAIRYETDAYVLLRDSVVWESAKEERLRTSQLIWDERKQQVYSDRFVVVTRPEEIIYSQGFEANQDFSNIRMKAVQGRMKIEDLSKELE